MGECGCGQCGGLESAVERVGRGGLPFVGAVPPRVGKSQFVGDGGWARSTELEVSFVSRIGVCARYLSENFPDVPRIVRGWMTMAPPGTLFSSRWVLSLGDLANDGHKGFLAYSCWRGNTGAILGPLILGVMGIWQGVEDASSLRVGAPVRVDVVDGECWRGVVRGFDGPAEEIEGESFVECCVLLLERVCELLKERA